MEVVGQKAESIHRRSMITDETMLRDRAARLAVLLGRSKSEATRAVSPTAARER